MMTVFIWSQNSHKHKSTRRKRVGLISCDAITPMSRQNWQEFIIEPMRFFLLTINIYHVDFYEFFIFVSNVYCKSPSVVLLCSQLSMRFLIYEHLDFTIRCINRVRLKLPFHCVTCLALWITTVTLKYLFLLSFKTASKHSPFQGAVLDRPLKWCVL